METTTIWKYCRIAQYSQFPVPVRKSPFHTTKMMVLCRLHVFVWLMYRTICTYQWIVPVMKILCYWNFQMGIIQFLPLWDFVEAWRSIKYCVVSLQNNPLVPRKIAESITTHLQDIRRNKKRVEREVPLCFTCKNSQPSPAWTSASPRVEKGLADPGALRVSALMYNPCFRQACQREGLDFLDFCVTFFNPVYERGACIWGMWQAERVREAR